MTARDGDKLAKQAAAFEAWLKARPQEQVAADFAARAAIASLGWPGHVYGDGSTYSSRRNGGRG